MLPNVTQSFELQKPDVESFRAEAMLRLLIVEHCSTVWKYATIWKKSSRTLCNKKQGKLQLRCSNVDWRKTVGRKVWWPRQAFSAHAHWEQV